MLGIDKAKKDIDAARMSANWTSLENFMRKESIRLLWIETDKDNLTLMLE